MSPPNVNKAEHSAHSAHFETQSRRHQSKIGVSVAPQKRTYVLQKLKKKELGNGWQFYIIS